MPLSGEVLGNEGAIELKINEETKHISSAEITISQRLPRAEIPRIRSGNPFHRRAKSGWQEVSQSFLPTPKEWSIPSPSPRGHNSDLGGVRGLL